MLTHTHICWLQRYGLLTARRIGNDLIIFVGVPQLQRAFKNILCIHRPAPCTWEKEEEDLRARKKRQIFCVSLRTQYVGLVPSRVYFRFFFWSRFHSEPQQANEQEMKKFKVHKSFIVRFFLLYYFPHFCQIHFFPPAFFYVIVWSAQLDIRRCSAAVRW